MFLFTKVTVPASSLIATWVKLSATFWVCLKMGYTHRMAVLEGTWFTNGFRGRLFPDKPIFLILFQVSLLDVVLRTKVVRLSKAPRATYSGPSVAAPFNPFNEEPWFQALPSNITVPRWVLKSTNIAGGSCCSNWYPNYSIYICPKNIPWINQEYHPIDIPWRKITYLISFPWTYRINRWYSTYINPVCSDSGDTRMTQFEHRIHIPLISYYLL